MMTSFAEGRDRVYTAATALHMTSGAKTVIDVVVLVAAVGFAAFMVRLWNLWH